MAQNSLIEYSGNLMLFVASGSTAGTKIPIAFSTSAKLNITMKTRDTTNKDDGAFGSKSYGRIAWDMSSDALMSFSTTGSTYSVEDLWGMMLAHTLIYPVFGHISGSSAPYTLDTAKKYFQGSAYITSLPLTAGNDDNGTFSITLEGAGALVLT